MFATPFSGESMHRRLALAVFAAAFTLASCASSNGTAKMQPMNSLTAEQARDGWKLLFDGKSTAGWRNYRSTSISPGWTVENGTLVKSGENAGDIVTLDQYASFDLVLDWKISEGGNSGILYRATEENDYIWQSAPEMQILDDARHADGKSPLTSAGSNFALHEAPRGIVHPAGEWNTARVLVNGNHVEHWLNGTKLLEYELGSDDWKARVAGSKFATMPRYGMAARGYIGLQDHGDRVEFRNIRIRSLP
jgi:hypothetical protein